MWTGDTFTALLHLAQLHAVYADLTATMAQQSGSPPPSGVWSFSATAVIDAPGSSHFGHLKVDSGVTVDGVSSFRQVNAGSGVAAAGVSSFDTLNAASGINGPGVNSFGLIRASGAYASVSSGLGDSNTVVTVVGSTEIVVNSISFPTNGNRVLLRGYVYGLEFTAFSTTRFRIRANSLGGAILETGIVQESNGGNSRLSSTLIASDLPTSNGAQCYVLTAQVIGLANSFQLLENRLMAIETHLRI